jgi:hypothetical protein
MMHFLYPLTGCSTLRERREIRQRFELNQGLSTDAKRQRIADQLPGGQKKLDETRNIEQMNGVADAAQEHAWGASRRLGTYFEAMRAMEGRKTKYDPGEYLQSMRAQIEGQRQLLNPTELPPAIIEEAPVVVEEQVVPYRPTPIIVVHPSKSEQAQRNSLDTMYWVREINRVHNRYVEYEQVLDTLVRTHHVADHKHAPLQEGLRQLRQGKQQMVDNWRTQKAAVPVDLTPPERIRALCDIDARFVKTMDVFLAQFSSPARVLQYVQHGRYDDGYNPPTVIVR